jgi:mRNA interferase RelE/StbE
VKTSFRKCFVRDLKKVKDRTIRAGVQKVIEEVEAAPDLTVVKNVKKLSGSDNFFRIRLGSYRIGIEQIGDTVEFIRCLPRKDLYRYFP